jgi:hypothetical protein
MEGVGGRLETREAAPFAAEKGTFEPRGHRSFPFVLALPLGRSAAWCPCERRADSLRNLMQAVSRLRPDNKRLISLHFMSSWRPARSRQWRDLGQFRGRNAKG